MTLRRALFPLIIVLLLITAGLSTAGAQTSDQEYFPQYGHWVRGEFLTLYHSASDPARLFGQPITGVFPDRFHPGLQVQYFERARMDYDPTRPVGQRVSLADLGEFVYDENQAGQPADFSTSTNMCRQFSNGKSVCFAFLQFYDTNNGAKYFGLPLSNTEFLDGRLVQYFQRARMEWRSEMPTGQKVVLTELGLIDFDHRVADPSLRKAEASDNVMLIQPKVYAFIAHPLMANGQRQQIYVLVRDQYDNPLPGTQVMITLVYPDGHTESRRPAAFTNADGVTQDSFSVQHVDPNQVIQINVEADISSDLKGSATTWFRVWW